MYESCYFLWSGGGGRQGGRASSSYFYHGFHFRFSSSSVLCVSKQGRGREDASIYQGATSRICGVAQMDKALAGGVGLHGETHYPESKVDWAIGLLMLASVPVWVTGVLLYCAYLCLWGD